MSKAELVTMTMSDGKDIAVYHCEPSGVRRGGLVLIQEIFGITQHIKDMAHSFCAEGYEVLAPSLFDREHPDFVIAADEIHLGKELAGRHPFDQSVEDAKTCARALKPEGLVFAVGYCYGGSVAYALACRSHDLAAAVSYYGKLIPDMADEVPRCPLLCHFGRRDSSIPLEGVEHLQRTRPELRIELYDAGHGFNSPRPAQHNPQAASLARDRTLDFFRAHGA